jgi:hypothetical protein
MARVGSIRYALRDALHNEPRRSPIALRITIDSVVVQDKEPAAADVDGAAVLLSLRAGAYYDLNEVAGEIWCMLAEPQRVSDIFDRLAQTHDVNADTLARDVIPFLQELVDERLLRSVAEGGAR